MQQELENKFAFVFVFQGRSGAGAGQEVAMAAGSGWQAAVAFFFNSVGLGESSGSHDTRVHAFYDMDAMVHTSLHKSCFLHDDL
jgi:hypothetical protein